MVYIIVSVKIHVGQDIYSGHYYCDLFYYNTVTWWVCDDDKITNGRGYPENLYDELSH